MNRPHRATDDVTGMTGRIWISIFALCFALAQPATAQTLVAALEEDAASGVVERVGSETGYPLPRFVSMDAAEGRARRGPSRSHRIDWVFTRRGMPLIIIAEHGHWRRVVDFEGEGGWMHYSLLSGVRTGIVEADMVEMRSRPEPTAPVRAYVELGVIGRLQECRDDWCLFASGGHRGWIPQDTLWGTTQGETFD